MPRLLCQSAQSGTSARLRSTSASRFVGAPLLMREDAGVVQRGRMIGDHLEHPAIQLPGLDELLVLLKQDGERDRLLERQLAAAYLAAPCCRRS